MQKFLKALAELLVYLVFRDIRKTCIFLAGLIFSIVVVSVVSKYGRSPLPYPVLWVILGTILFMKGWK